MRGRKEGASRREFVETVDKSKAEMEGQKAELEMHASDIEQERRTLESLEGRGAEEDVRQTEEGISGAEDVSAEGFGSENRKLESLHGENENIESDFQERRESTESDLGKISEAKLESSEAVRAMLRAKESAIRGKEFLSEQSENTRRAREESERAQGALEDRVRAIRGGR